MLERPPARACSTSVLTTVSASLATLPPLRRRENATSLGRSSECRWPLGSGRGKLTSVEDDKEGRDVNDVFEAFREGVTGRVRADDVGAHFDLGIAYAEMGLFVEAAAEFEIVLQHDPTNARARAELASAHVQMGNPPEHGPVGNA